MIARPALKPNLHIEVVEGEGYFLLSENARYVLEGPHVAYVVPLIDGWRTSDLIAASLNHCMAPADVFACLELLEQEGHIEESNLAMPACLGAFWAELGVSTFRLPEILSRIVVQVVAFDGLDPRLLVDAIRSFGIATSDVGNVLVVIVDDYLSPGLAELNRICLERHIPWLLLKPTGVNVWLGPIFSGPNCACWSCLAYRLRANREVEAYIERRTGVSGPFPVAKARVWTSPQQAYSMAVVQLVRWLTTGSNTNLESRILVCETISLSFTYHTVVKRPQCPACGNAALGSADDAIPALGARTTSNLAEGGHRTEAPEVTFNRFSHHLSPITGVVSALQPSPWHGAGPLRVYVAGHNFALKNDGLYFLKDGLRTHSSGKGRSDAQARTSALCEALERYSGIYRPEEERRLEASFRDLGSEAIHPNACMLFSARQYIERDQWNKRGSRFQIVPLPFEERAQIHWSPVYSISKRQIRYLPTSYLYYNYPTRTDQFYCWSNSNGNAAGTTFEEACVQGLYEVIERDSVCIWWYNRLRRPAVDLRTFADPYFGLVSGNCGCFGGIPRASFITQPAGWWICGQHKRVAHNPTAATSAEAEISSATTAGIFTPHRG